MSDWTHGWDNTPYVLTHSIVTQVRNCLDAFLSVRQVESTFIERMYRAPSWMIRVEGVVHEGQFHVFEVEDRPAGIGMLKKYANPHGLELHFREWPHVVVVDSGARNGIDDQHWGAHITTLEQAMVARSLVLVRARPEEQQFHCLAENAVAPVVHEGNKQYGQRLGWWYRVSKTSENFALIAELIRNTAVVVKPLVGTRARGVNVYVPEHLKRLMGVEHCADIRSFGTIQKQLKTPHGCFIQTFKFPMKFSWRPEHEWGIIRIYFRYSIAERRYVLLEGCPGFWNTRPNSLVIHGTPDSFFGPLKLES